MQYQARGLSRDNLITELRLEARDEEDARRQLKARGLVVTDVIAIDRTIRWSSNLGQRGGRFELVLFSQELLALLNAGLSIVESLEALHEKGTNEATRAVLDRLLEGLREGRRFSAVLGEQPSVFPPLYVGIVQAAEGTSDLPQSLSRYIDYRHRVDGIRAKIVSASIYPLILLFVGCGVTLFLIGYVVPRFAEVYQGAGRELPWMSKLLLAWGQYAASHTKELGIAAGVTAASAIVAWRRSVTRGGLARIVSRIPGVSERARIFELARLYLTLGMLLEGGIPIVAAINTVQSTVPTDIGIALRNAGKAVEAGIPLSVAFENNRLTTPISLRMLRVGERSGGLGTMLMQSASFYDGEISRWIDRFTRSFEPLLMAAIGLIVGTIVVLLYMPIFDLAGSLS